MITQQHIDYIYHLMHKVVWIHIPGDEHWILPIFVIVLVIGPAWLILHIARITISNIKSWKSGLFVNILKDYNNSSKNIGYLKTLENFVLSATASLQVRVIIFSIMSLPATYAMLLLPKLIINQALTEDGPDMNVLGLSALSPPYVLFILCAIYLITLSFGSLVKYQANVLRGKIHERIVRKIRLSVIRRRRGERCARSRSTLAAVAIQECEPIGYFGGSLLLVPLIQGGTLLTSLVFLFFQDVALAFAAMIMLPLQIAVLPKLQRRINDRVRKRVLMSRALNEALAHGESTIEDGSPLSATRLRIRQTKAIEQAQIEISRLKSRFKILYNFTTNLTPFFFFTIGGYLVLQQRLSLGALVAALAAYREIAPALRELFDFARNWSDARARYAEVIAVIRTV